MMHYYVIHPLPSLIPWWIISESAAVFQAPDAATRKRAAIDIDDECNNDGRQIKKLTVSIPTIAAGAANNNDAGAGAGAGVSSSLAPTNILQLLQKETELHEKTREGHQHERKKLQAKLAMLVKAKSKKREKTVVVAAPNQSREVAVWSKPTLVQISLFSFMMKLIFQFIHKILR